MTDFFALGNVWVSAEECDSSHVSKHDLLGKLVISCYAYQAWIVKAIAVVAMFRPSNLLIGTSRDTHSPRSGDSGHSNK